MEYTKNKNKTKNKFQTQAPKKLCFIGEKFCINLYGLNVFCPLKGF